VESEAWERSLGELLSRWEEETTMPYVTGFERLGIQKETLHGRGGVVCR
jgi:hypothetical protein